MEYSINQLAKLAGISTRTLRHYDDIRLLSPKRTHSNNYRVYGESELDRLQQILFYRELGISLDSIKGFLCAKDYDRAAELHRHLSALRTKKEQIELLIANVEKTIAASKGECIMHDAEKFEGFKRELLEENETQYGREIREAFGDDTIDASNAMMMHLTAEQYEQAQALSRQINETLRTAFEQGDPAGALAQHTCALHKEWLGFFWPRYSAEAHAGLAQMYIDDPRFKKHYEAIAVGCTEFLRDAIHIFCQSQH